MRFRVRMFSGDVCAMMLCILAGSGCGAVVKAEEGDLTPETIRAAVEKSLPLLVKGAEGSMKERPNCFTCHNQAMPVLALTTARRRGFDVDADMLRRQLEFTVEFLEKNRSGYLEGSGQGGQADTAGTALWALENGGWTPDETTAAVTEYLLRYQNDLEHWKATSTRPPTENSAFTTTYLALRALKHFGTEEQRERIERRTSQVREWLLTASAADTEDRVSRLRTLALAGAPVEDITLAGEELLRTQRADGGWAQLDGMDSDAYATATALVGLHEAGGLDTTDPVYRNGLRFLLAIQLEDGSWRVKSRSEPFQKYYESGYPHGEDQFISISAAGWATTALALALEAPLRLKGGQECPPPR